MILYLIYLAIFILSVYFFSHIFQSLFKSILIILIILILIVLLKSMREPVVILGKYRVSNFTFDVIK